MVRTEIQELLLSQACWETSTQAMVNGGLMDTMGPYW